MTGKLKAAEQHLNEHGVYPEDFINSSSYFGAVKAVAILKESAKEEETKLQAEHG